MKTPYVIGAIIVVLVVLGFVFHSMQAHKADMMQAASSTPVTTMTSTTTTTTTTNTSGSGSLTPQVSSQPAQVAAPAAQHFTVNGNDATADLKAISVPAGTNVSITFGADAGTTYHGGLDFRSSVVNTGTITPGSTKTVNFTATKSFSFTPYWPSTNIAKPYTIDVVVK